MRPLILLLWMVAGCTGSPSVPDPTRVEGQPDVLVLTLCTVRADHLGTYGNASPTSPFIDELADAGVVFERALTNAPWTRPGIAAMITGQAPRTLGIDGGHTLDPAFTTLAEYAKAAGYRTVGVTANPNARSDLHFDQGYDTFHDPKRIWAQGYGRDKLDAKEVAEIAKVHIAATPADQPWLAHLVMVDAHRPYAPSSLPYPHRLGGRSAIDEYDRQIRKIDTAIAGLLADLQQAGRSPDLIVINADHGEGFAEHRRDDRGHGRHVYDSVLWVPFIVHAPGLGVLPRRVHERVELVDTTPTLLELMGIEPVAGLEGQSLVTGLRGGPTPTRPVGISESNYGGRWRAAVVTDDFKLISEQIPGRAREAVRLFDYRLDTHERIEADPAATQAVKLELMAALATWRAAHPTLQGEPEVEPEAEGVDKELMKALGYLDTDN